VGVAFNMSYGVCGSGAYTADALTVFPTYFRYDPSIDEEDRDEHSAAEWFSLIQDEINNGRPMQYRIRSHSIVCDGWRDTGGQNQYHMNYGWGGPFTTWFAIDSLYCYWVLPDSLCPPMEEFLIRNIKPLSPDSIPFAPAVNYGAGDRPSSVFCADLDGDTYLDLAVANYNTDNVSILKNNRDGTFKTAVNYGAEDYPSSVFCADLDGDGDLDLVVANTFSDSVSILKNNGDGIFESAVNYGADNGPVFVFCADLDEDCDLDLAVVNYNSGDVSILENNGDGTFQSAVNYGAGYGASSVFCADLDGDADLDLAVANYSSDNVSILKNNGDGTFQTAVNYETGDNPLSVFCADLDNDTDLDLAVANANSYNVSILKNNGDGTFASPVNYGSGDGPRSVFCMDLDGDAYLDLAVANEISDNVSVLKNNGDGTFQTAVNYGAGDGPWSVFCADLDGDADLDLAVANDYSDNVSILKNLTQVPGNSPPYPFPLLSPADGDTTSSIVEFHWAKTQDVNLSDQIRYDLYLSTVPGFDPDSTTVYDSLVCSQFTDTLHVGMYYWKVKAKDNWAAGTWSKQTWHFVYFIRGDVSGDGQINASDVVYLINYLFIGGPPPVPLAAGDCNRDTLVDVSDVVYLLNYLFVGGPPPSG
jgi:6-phosphogluconolactonase (cycloisomerase 2 family)